MTAGHIGLAAVSLSVKGEILIFKHLKSAVVLSFIFVFILSSFPSAFAVTDEEIQELRQQIKVLSERLEKMEAEHAAAKRKQLKPKRKRQRQAEWIWPISCQN